MTAQNSDNSTLSSSVVKSVASVSSGNKEVAAAIKTGEATIKEISQDVEIPQSIKAVGVEKIEGKIELPPDIKKLGVTSGASQMPVNSATTVTLPLTDDKILSGLNAPIAQSIKWLAVWCLLKLQKAHLTLKKIHGSIIRIKSNS